MRAVVIATAAASWAYWAASESDAVPAGLDFDGGTLARLDAQHAALVLWEDTALVSVTSAGPDVHVRRTERDGRRGLQATAAVAASALLLHVVPEDRSIEHWQGWNRSFPALVTAYAREKDVWRQLVTFRAKTSAHSTSALRMAELDKTQPFPAGTGSVWLRSEQDGWQSAGATVRSERPPPLPRPEDALQPVGKAEAEKWDLHGQTPCRPPEEVPVKLGDPSEWPQIPWCGREGGTVLPALHLWWHLPSQGGVEWMYNTLTVEESAPFTFFMGLGWRGGYFGIQEHASSQDRYVLFSVWDGAEPVEVVDVGAGFSAARFGNEGTGVSSHARFNWRVNEPVEFAVHADVNDGATTYSGYVYDVDRAVWRLVGKLRTKACGPGATGLIQQPSSFLEVWTPSPACALRRARYGPAHWRSTSGRWTEAESVHMSATCGLVDAPANLACPPTGLDVAPDMMAVGGNISNHALQAFGLKDGALAAKELPKLEQLPALLRAPLPFSDGSPGPGTRTRPLLRWGSQRNRLEPFGEAFGERPVCPWYVTDCDGI